MNQNQDPPPVLPTYAEAMRTQQNDHHRTISEYGATSPSHNSPYPPNTVPYPIPNAPNSSQPMPMPMPEHPPYGFCDQQQYPQNQPQHVPPTNIQQPPIIRVIRHVSAPPSRQRSSHPKIIFAFILALIIIAAILRATIRHH